MIRMVPMASRRNRKEMVDVISELPESLQNKFCKPVDCPNIELELRLNEVSAQKLPAFTDNMFETSFLENG
jgi:hypothetical protein